MNIEPLEARVAPAAVFTYTDVDGDKVTITTSKGTDAQLAAAVTLQDSGIGQELQLIDFSLEAAAFAGTKLTVKSKRTELGGDGLVNVGAIDATGANGGGALDLGLVVIRGDLGQIDAGDSALGTPAVKGLTVNSMGQFGLTTQGVGGALFSNVVGPLGFLKVTGNMIGAEIECQSCGSITIGGSLIGGSASSSGSIQSFTSIGPVKIGGNIEGGTGSTSGAIRANTSITSISVGGSLLGSDGGTSGAIIAFEGIGSVKVGGSVVGGGASASGVIRADLGDLGKVTIGGSLVGGLGGHSGLISSDSAIGTVKIGGSIVGNSEDSGRIEAVTTIGAITLGGSLIGGGGDNSGSIFATGSISSVKIGGSVQGNLGSESGRVSTPGALGAVNIGGSVLGGAGSGSGTVSGVDRVGPVKIGGDVVGGSESGAGSVDSTGLMTSVAIGGSVYGGLSNFTGVVIAGDLGPVKIAGSLIGGSVNVAADVGFTGAIHASRIASVFIGGSVIAGTEGGGGTLTESGSIRATNDIGHIVVKGSLVGNASNPVLITARGSATPLPGKDVAIRSLSVDGQVLFANILAGYSSAATPQALNANAQIGPVIVGDWIASNLVSGVQDDGDFLLDDHFGDGDDQLISGGGTETIARIASVLIRGTAIGSLSVIGDHYGFVAQQIGSFKIGSTVIRLTPGPGNDIGGLSIGITGDLRIVEIAG